MTLWYCFAMRLDKLKPEKRVECAILLTCIQLGWSVDVIDSKGQWSPSANRFIKSKAAPKGFSDICGNTGDGRAVFIELKRVGVRQVSFEQKKFLERKINSGCIAGPIRSSAELLKLKDMTKNELLAWLNTFSVSLPNRKKLSSTARVVSKSTP